MKFLRLTLLMCAVAAFAVVPTKANSLKKIGSKIGAVFSSSQPRFGGLYICGIPVNTNTKIGAYLTKKADAFFKNLANENTRFQATIEPKMVSMEEINNFECPKKSKFCNSFRDSSHKQHTSVIGVGDDVKVVSIKTESASIVCKKCNVHLKSEREEASTNKTQKRAEESTKKIGSAHEDFVDAEYTVNEQPEIKALPVKSMPGKGFYARIKAMFSRK